MYNVPLRLNIHMDSFMYIFYRPKQLKNVLRIYESREFSNFCLFREIVHLTRKENLLRGSVSMVYQAKEGLMVN